MNKINKLRRHKYAALIFLSFGLGIYLFVAVLVKLLTPVDEDRIEKYWEDGDYGFTGNNLEKAESDIRINIGRIKSYISTCNSFPDRIETTYNTVKGSFVCQSSKKIEDLKIKPWIDPWGRTYQVRYDKERLKLLIRSLGRNSEELNDDIIQETYLNTPGGLFESETEKCKNLPENDKTCAFNRGWH